MPKEAVTAFVVCPLIGFGLFAWLVLPADFAPTAPSRALVAQPASRSVAAPTPPAPEAPLGDLQARALDGTQPLSARVLAVRSLSRAPRGGSDLLDVLARLPARDPRAVQLRSTLLTALAPHAHDPRVRARWVAALQPEAPRHERTLVLSTLASLPRPRWAIAHVQPLLQDPDPTIRRQAASTLKRIEG